jgi:hypothetical protein
MRASAWVIGVLIALGMAGCADRFRAGTPRLLVQEQAPAAQGSSRLTVGPLPADVSWLADAVRLFETAETGTLVQLAGDPTPSGAGASPPVNASAMTPGATPGRGRRDERSPDASADLQVVSLPLTAAQASELAAVPPQVESIVGTALLPRSLEAAQQAGRMLALPVATRWLALAWNPARMMDSAAPVPPHLEAWVDQLRALRRNQPDQPPVVAAWAEREIAGSFALLLAAHGGRLLDDAGYSAFASAEGEAAVQLMIRMLEERLVQPTALETDTARLAGSLTGPYTYWLCSSDALNAAPPGHERLASLRLSGLPVTREQYRYPDSTTAVLVQFRGIAVHRDSARPAATWRLARFLADPVVLRSSPAATTVLAHPPSTESALVRRSRALVAQPGAAPWPDAPGLNESLGRFLHAALRRILTPREALERAALQFRQPGVLPESSAQGDEPAASTDRYPASSGSSGAGDPAPSGSGGTGSGPTTAPGSDAPPSDSPMPDSVPSGAQRGYPGPGGASSGTDREGQNSDQGTRGVPETP